MHNYQKIIEELQKKGIFTPGLHIVEVSHDTWCEIHQGKWCNCKPDVVVKKKIQEL